MSPRVWHLDCCTMCPFGRSIVNGTGSFFEVGRMVAHVLLIEGEDGLVAVDTGVGTDDCREGGARLGRGFMAFARPTLDPAETLVRQVERLGFKPSDVKHILPTHLDVDHAGGLPDFPEATVHILAAEKKAATERSTLPEKLRYRPAQLAHGPRWKVYEPGGDTWMGLASVRALSDDIVLVPTRGHTRGHACVAVRSGEKWLLHCGDAYFFHGEMAPEPTCPPALRFFQARVAIDDAARLANQARLRALHAERSAEVEVFSAHCIVEFARYAGR